MQTINVKNNDLGVVEKLEEKVVNLSSKISSLEQQLQEKNVLIQSLKDRLDKKRRCFDEIESMLETVLDIDLDEFCNVS